MAGPLDDLRFELGGGIGYGRTYSAPPAESYHDIDSEVSDRGPLWHAYAEARNRYLGAEIGALSLPEYHSKSSTMDYPKYKGLPPGTYPQTSHGQQDITGRARYGRLNLYGPRAFGVEPYGFYGRARVGTDNHEHAVYNGVDEADLQQHLTKNAKYYGGGLKLHMPYNMTMRAEYGKIPKATSDYHTLDRDVQMFNLGIGREF